MGKRDALGGIPTWGEVVAAIGVVAVIVGGPNHDATPHKEDQIATASRTPAERPAGTDPGAPAEEAPTAAAVQSVLLPTDPADLLPPDHAELASADHVPVLQVGRLEAAFERDAASLEEFVSEDEELPQRSEVQIMLPYLFGIWLDPETVVANVISDLGAPPGPPAPLDVPPGERCYFIAEDPNDHLCISLGGQKVIDTNPSRDPG